MTRLHRLSMIFLKYTPVIGALLMLLHVMFLSIGLTGFIAENLIGLTLWPYITALVWSKAFHFCTTHRLFLSYIFLVTCCINYEGFFGFGLTLLAARWVVLILGILLFS